MSAKVSRKVSAGGAAGAAATVLVWFLGVLGAEVPPEVAAAFATLLAGAFGWLATDPDDDGPGGE